MRTPTGSPLRDARPLDTLVLGIELPAAVVSAIHRKVEQYYSGEEYTFRVARKEGIRTQEVEAKGIRASRRSSAKGSRIPTCAGVASRRRFSSRGPQSKVVIVGGGKDGLPIILGNVDGPPLQPAPPFEGGAMLKERPTAAQPGDAMGESARCRPVDAG